MFQTIVKWNSKQQKAAIFLVNIRNMTATEVSTALRPFYFTVHPDLFGQYPCQRKTNENSLKQLSSVIETLQSKRTIKPCNLPFYLRDKTYQEGDFRLVKIYLKDPCLRETVLTILKSCKLPTEYVDKIPKAPKIPKQNVKPRQNVDYSKVSEDDPLYAHIIMNQKIKEAIDLQTLKRWLDKNYESALKQYEQNRPVREDIEKLRTLLCEQLGITEFRWECGWNETHFRGCLLSFKALVDQHLAQMHLLRGRVVVFAPFTGLSLDGHIMLNSGEVRHNWLDLIKNVRKYDASLHRIPAFERSVSQVLREMKVVRRKFMPKVMAGEYESHLRHITTSLSDYIGRGGYPKSWPESLKEYELVIETGAGPLMVSPTGQFIVPSTCPGSLLVSFFTENLKEAAERMNIYKENKHVERSLRTKCLEVLQLHVLHKDDNVTPDLMIECCKKLLEHRNDLQNLKGVNLNIATYYSVLSDGTVCIPWNFKI